MGIEQHRIITGLPKESLILKENQISKAKYFCASLPCPFFFLFSLSPPPPIPIGIETIYTLFRLVKISGLSKEDSFLNLLCLIKTRCLCFLVSVSLWPGVVDLLEVLYLLKQILLRSVKNTFGMHV